MKQHRLNKTQIVELLGKYQTGKFTCVDLGKIYNISANAVQGLLKRRGIAITSQTYLQRKYKINETFFDTINTEEKAYFLGILYADGYNNTDRKTVTISLQEKDLELLEKLRVLIEHEKPLSHVKFSNWSDQYRIVIHNKRISEKLSEHGCIKAKTYSLTYPPFLEKHLYRHFIRGYFDGDGYVGKRSASITSSKAFCQALKIILNIELGINTYHRKPHPHNSDLIESLEISGERKCRIFLNWIYKDSSIYLQRKYNKYIVLVGDDKEFHLNRSFKSKQSTKDLNKRMAY